MHAHERGLHRERRSDNFRAVSQEDGARQPDSSKAPSAIAIAQKGTDPAIAPTQSLPAPAKDGSISKRLQRLDLDHRPSSVPPAPAPASHVLTAGDVIGHYRVLEHLGSGGMGYIHRARDERLQRDVAIKLAFESLDADSDGLLREARALAALNHPNVVTVYEVGVHQGCAYIVMELLRGETLRARIDRALPSLVDALSWACDVLRGLSAAHDAGMVHLDVKPENVFLTKDGTAKLLDFGVAHQKRTGVHQNENIVGTVAYMAPEQLLGEPLDFRADIFAFGIVLHELVTGKHPFMKPQMSATMAALMNGNFFQDNLVADPEVEAIVRRCMQLEPSERPQSAAQVVEELERLLRARRHAISRSSQVSYAETDHGNIAFQCSGTAQGPNVLVVPGLLSRFDAWAHEPEGAAFLRALTDAAQIVLFDHAGLGASDRVPGAALPSTDDEIDHLDAVLDAAGMTRAVLLAFDTGAPLAAFYAAVRPERVAGLVVYGGAPSYADSDARGRLSARAEGWGTDKNGMLCAPSFGADPRISKWIASWERVTASPKIARSRIAVIESTDITPVLPFITCPTLVLQRQDDRFCAPTQSLPFVEAIAGAEHVLLSGTDHLPCAGAQEIVPHIVHFARACVARSPSLVDDGALGTWILTNAPVEAIPACLRPHVELERDSLRLIRIDRPGLARRLLADHWPHDAKAVMLCMKRGAASEDVFVAAQPLFLETAVGSVAASALAQKVIDGTVRVASDKPLPSAERSSLMDEMSTETIALAPPLLAGENASAQGLASGARRWALGFLLTAVLSVFVFGYLEFGRKIQTRAHPVGSAQEVMPDERPPALSRESDSPGAMVKEGDKELEKARSTTPEPQPVASSVAPPDTSASAMAAKHSLRTKQRTSPAPVQMPTQSSRPTGTLEIKLER